MRIEERIAEVAKLYGKELLKYPNVVGFSNIAQPRIRKGKVIEYEKVLRVYVTKKLPKEMLKPSEVIPSEFYGVKTDVVKIGKIRKVQGYRDRYRPIPCGVSTSRADENAAGTIGWWVIDANFNLYLISNNHVWAKENQGVQGDPLVQPGILDGGDPNNDVFADLYDFVPIDFSGAENYVDVAVARCLDMLQCFNAIMAIGGVVGKRDPQLNETVRKVGRSTGVTVGTVTDVSATLQVEYDSGTATFTDVFIVQSDQKIVEPGDSGSPILSDNKEFLGLLFAGNDDGTLFVGCKTSNIESQLSNKLGVSVSVLVANAPIPFEKEVVVKYIEPNPIEAAYASMLSFTYMTTMLYVFGILVNIVREEQVLRSRFTS